MKPHITLFWLPQPDEISEHKELWQCSGLGHTILADSPKKAYEDWYEWTNMKRNRQEFIDKWKLHK